MLATQLPTEHAFNRTYPANFPVRTFAKLIAAHVFYVVETHPRVYEQEGRDPVVRPEARDFLALAMRDAEAARRATPDYAMRVINYRAHGWGALDWTPRTSTAYANALAMAWARPEGEIMHSLQLDIAGVLLEVTRDDADRVAQTVLHEYIYGKAEDLAEDILAQL